MCAHFLRCSHTCTAFPSQCCSCCCATAAAAPPTTHAPSIVHSILTPSFHAHLKYTLAALRSLLCCCIASATQHAGLCVRCRPCTASGTTRRQRISSSFSGGTLCTFTQHAALSFICHSNTHHSATQVCPTLQSAHADGMQQAGAASRQPPPHHRSAAPHSQQQHTILVPQPKLTHNSHHTSSLLQHIADTAQQRQQLHT